MVTPVAMEPLLGYHPCSIGFLTSRRDPAVGQCQTGSLTGAVAQKYVFFLYLASFFAEIVKKMPKNVVVSRKNSAGSRGPCALAGVRLYPAARRQE